MKVIIADTSTGHFTAIELKRLANALAGAVVDRLDGGEGAIPAQTAGIESGGDEERLWNEFLGSVGFVIARRLRLRKRT